MHILNSLLQEQINKYQGETPIPEYLSNFLSIVSETYEHYEKDQKLLGDVLNSEGNGKEEAVAHQEHLEISQQIAHIGSWELDIENLEDTSRNRLAWSDETYRILGFEPGSVTPSTEVFFSRVHPEEVELMRNIVKDAVTNGQPSNIEYRLLLPDGMEKFILARSETLVDPKTKAPLKLSGTIQDITDRKKAEEELRIANNELRTLFENMQEVFFSVDMETFQQLQMSPACEQVYGYPREAFIENPNLWYEMILEEDRHIISANDPILFAGQSVINTFRTRNKDGKIKWLEVKITPTLNKEGKLIRIDGIAADVTKRKEVENALRDSEYKFRSLIENNSDAIMIINENAEIVFSSNSLFRITGYHPEDVIGIPNITFIHPDDIISIQKSREDLLSNPGKTNTIQYRRRRKDGSYIWCESIATNMMEDPIMHGIIINFRDITERKEYIEALKASNEDLKKIKMEMDRFVYSISHDLRAPLTSMLGVLQLIQSEVTDTLVLSDLQLIEGSIKKLDGFILDILDYSRNSRLEIKLQAVCFNDITNEVMNHLKYMGKGKTTIDIRVDINEDLYFYSDKGRLTIILNNLISNAMRYCNPEVAHPFVEINITSTSREVNIRVKDNGIGISEENQQKIFDIFYRVSSNSIGSGLGLYIVKEVVAKLSGSIQLQSSPGKGSEFSIHLPNLVNV
ncbi:PAS domain S-box-containing protein [Chitinophaga sp. CF118]|uniref:PAS domain-containing protein n=1 Tax=Chitinophaga sp. CF118 TaxID=1884367 RepID=UPI0008F10123|nr:PAS domain-containing protein [Chitinophaga sp. CF118]SFD55695.1 PAS domain S-box-containing protein [Chitinophaga sp. CF118]